MMCLYGMTETAPHATCSKLRPSMNEWSEDQKYMQRLKQGIPTAFLEARIMRLDGTQAPHDGTTIGEIELRGPWVSSSYYNLPEEAQKWSPDGWFRTGDMGHIDEHSYGLKSGRPLGKVTWSSRAASGSAPWTSKTH